MRRKLNLLALMVLFHCVSLAQNKYSIKAYVVGLEDSLWGDVLILSPTDSSLITGSYFEGGKVLIENLTEKELLLKFRSFGYLDTIIHISYQGDNVNLGTVTMNSQVTDIDSVEVVYKVPLFETTEDGKLNINVEKTILSSSVSVMELLSKSPGIIVADGEIMVVGKGKALVYLNGRRIQKEQLGAIQVVNIKKIEVITNPSSKYDAEGAAVVNIITIANPSEGFKGSFTQNLTHAVHPSSNSVLNLNFRKKKWSLNANYGFEFGKNWGEGIYTRSYSSPQGLYQSTYSINQNNRMTNFSNYSLGVGYQLNEHSNLTLEYSGLYNDQDFDVEGSNEALDPFSNETEIKTNNIGGALSTNNILSFNYNNTLDTLGSSLFIGGQYTRFTGKQRDYILEEIYENDLLLNKAERFNPGRNDIEIGSAQADYGKIFKNGNSWNLGMKASFAGNHGVVDLYSRSEGETSFTQYDAYSNDFSYQELIPALYSQFSGRLNDKLNYSFGVRTEQTIAQGKSNILDSVVIKRNYNNIFGNFSLGIKLGKKWFTNVSYSGRINRPSYQMLDPFLWYQDTLTSVQGNPFLLPETSHALEAVLNYNNFSLKLGYNLAFNSFNYIYIKGVGGDNSYTSKPMNFQEKHMYFVNLELPYQVKFWTSFSLISINVNQIKDDRPEFNIGAISPQLYVYSYHSFDIKELFKLELYGEYMGAQDDGIVSKQESYFISAGISTKFFKKKLNCSFLVDDIFFTYRSKGYYSVGNIGLNYFQRANGTTFRLSLKYTFGKLKNVVYDNKEVGKSEEKRIKK
jgi:hypothetical protein